jgi:CheY-like chemotaxis protein/HPt (histidine-containing phosphotransfer) domain-containing protein
LLFLVVDDDELSRELLTLLLEAEGYSVQVAASGEETVSQLKAGSAPPDVLLTDMQMPGLSGSFLAKALRKVTREGTSILAMSGSRPKDSELDGFDGFLLKPFTVEELRAVLEESTPQVSQAVMSKSIPLMPNPGPPDASDLHMIAAINEDIYSKMCDLMPESQLGEMYSLCVADARKRIALMATLAESRDDTQYRLEAHAIKGGAGMIGATELYKLAEAAERDGLEFDHKAKTVAKVDAEPGTSEVTVILDRFWLACERLERILVERLRN